MLSTLIYKSRAEKALSGDDITSLTASANEKNTQLGITGVLIYDGRHFFQLLEGPDTNISNIFEIITKDKRHNQIVKLFHDYAPARRFPNNGMSFVDIQGKSREVPFRNLISHISIEPDLWRYDRGLVMLERVARNNWMLDLKDGYYPDEWSLVQRPAPFVQVRNWAPDAAPCQFSFQPIIDTRNHKISSLEALMRSSTGGSPDECFRAVPLKNHHLFDLETKRYALSLARQIGIGDHSLSINLFPMSLVHVPDSIEFLLHEIRLNNLCPEQIIVELTEVEAISNFEEFYASIKKLRSSGIRIALDDFGAGFAGLSLLSKVQPDKIKIDRSLIDGISSDGPRQSIVSAIRDCADNLCISVVAEGVETLEDWCWLQSAGIDLYQGYLFAKPCLRGVADINWPERPGTASFPSG